MISEVFHWEMASRVAARAEIHQAAALACAHLPKGKTASSRQNLERVLVAMAEGALIPESGPVRTAGLGNLLRKFKQIVSAVKHYPSLWGKVKELLGVESIDELPGRFKELAKEGYKWLKKAIHHAFEIWPLKIYTFPEAKLLSVNKLLEKLTKLSPRFEKFLQDNVKPRVDQFDIWLKKHLPHLSKVVMVAIYIWIWLNVVEFEWDLKSLLEAATGTLSLSDLLTSLPGSVIGFLMNSLGFGTFSLLPIAFAARLAFVLAARYVEYDGGFKLNHANLQKDFGISPEEAASVVG